MPIGSTHIPKVSFQRLSLMFSCHLCWLNKYDTIPYPDFYQNRNIPHLPTKVTSINFEVSHSSGNMDDTGLRCKLAEIDEMQ